MATSLAAAVILFQAALAAAQEAKPNVVLIFMDKFAYGALGF